MNEIDTRRVIAADRLGDSVIVSFADGLCGVYSSALLYEILPQAAVLNDVEDTPAKLPAAASDELPQPLG